jgi:hypothetical protein
MITVKTNKNTYEVATNFDELTWNKYVALVKVSDGNIIERLKVATGITEDELLELSITDLKTIAEISCYTDILFLAEKYGGVELDINIGKETYGKLELARQAIIQSGNWVKAAQKVGLVYLNEDISEYQLPLAMAKIKTVFELLNEFLTKFKKLYEGETEAEEEMAGVEVFRRFGSFPTIDRLAITYGITHDEVLEMPAEIVMTKLLYDLEKAEYDERLMKIKTTK